MQVEEAQRVPNKMNPERPIPRHTIIKMPSIKVKERILKVARQKQEVTCKGAPIKLAADFSTETLQSRREWQEIPSNKKQRPITKLFYLVKLLIKMQGEIWIFPDKIRLKEYTSTKQALQDMLKGLL